MRPHGMDFPFIYYLAPEMSELILTLSPKKMMSS